MVTNPVRHFRCTGLADMQPTRRERKTSIAPLLTRLVREDKVGPWCIGDERVAMRSGTTYTVSHATARERAALDVFDVAPLAFGSYAETLRPRMHALNRLGHPGVIKIHDVGTLADGRPYVVRERVDGTLLSALVAAKPLAEADAIAIMRAISDVLVAAHAGGIVHRSLVHEHIVVLANGSVKLLDWGITDDVARPVKPGMSAARRTVSAADDVSALGVLMHRLLKWVPRSLERLWVSMLADDPTVRPTMAAVQRELASVPAAAPRTVTKPGIAPPPQPAMPATPESVVEVHLEAEPIAAPAECAGDAAVPEFVEEEHVKTIQTPVAALRAIAAADEPEASCEASTDGGAHVPSATPPTTAAEADTPTTVATLTRGARTSPRKARARLWHAVALASACAMPMLATALTSTDGPEARRAAAAAITDARAPRATVHMDVQASAPQPPSLPPMSRAVAVTSVEAPPPVVVEAVPAQREEPPSPPQPQQRAQVAPRVQAPHVAAKASPVAKRSRLVATAVPAAAAISPDDRDREALLAQYQRVTHNVLLAKRDLGPAAVADVTQRLQWIKLDPALSTRTSRQLMANTLQELQTQIDAARARH